MNRAILFALLAGVAAATWTVRPKLASTRITAALGAIVITGAALLVNTVVLLVGRTGGQEIVFTRDAIGLMLLAGVAAAGVDLFGLLQEPVTWGRLLAIGLIVSGTLLLQAQGG